MAAVGGVIHVDAEGAGLPVSEPQLRGGSSSREGINQRLRKSDLLLRGTDGPEIRTASLQESQTISTIDRVAQPEAKVAGNSGRASISGGLFA
jgi:hypothetical protein